jgi:hypothetical protein
VLPELLNKESKSMSKAKRIILCAVMSVSLLTVQPRQARSDGCALTTVLCVGTLTWNCCYYYATRSTTDLGDCLVNSIDESKVSVSCPSDPGPKGYGVEAEWDTEVGIELKGGLTSDEWNLSGTVTYKQTVKKKCTGLPLECKLDCELPANAGATKNCCHGIWQEAHVTVRTMDGYCSCSWIPFWDVGECNLGNRTGGIWKCSKVGQKWDYKGVCGECNFKPASCDNLNL